MASFCSSGVQYGAEGLCALEIHSHLSGPETLGSLTSAGAGGGREVMDCLLPLDRFFSLLLSGDPFKVG